MKFPLIIVPPVTITDAMLFDTDVLEDEHPTWNSGATYGLDVRVIKDHQVWLSLQAGNTNHPPETSDKWWARVGPTNAWALFDRSISTQTKKPNAMRYVLQPVQAITALALLNVRGCNTARVEVSHPTYGVLKDTTKELASLPLESGWWAWTFGERIEPGELLLRDIPPLPGCTITVELVGTVDLAVGVMLLGAERSFGEGVLDGMRLGFDDYSKKVRDDYGQTVLAVGEYAEPISFTVPILKTQLAAVRQLRASLRATPCLWITPDVVIYGFFQEFEILLAYTYVAECSITVEGFT